MRQILITEADRILQSGTLYSVTFNERIPPSGDIHDYYSTSPFWWPNPGSENGLPYICIDGKFNPERDRVSDREPFRNMVEDSRILTLAYTLTGNRAYGEQAALLWLDGETERLRQYLETVTLPRLASQITAEGKQPLELQRTRTWSYCTENLEHFFKLGRFAEQVGVDLFRYEAENGASLQAALDFLLPCVCQPSEWPYPQETAWQDHFIRHILFIAVPEYGHPRYLSALDCLKRPEPDVLAWLIGAN